MKAAWPTAVGVLAATAAPAAVDVTSPDKAVRVTVAVEAGRLSYHASFKDRPVIETSPLGIAVDQVDLGRVAAIGKVDRYRVDERYPWRGVHSEAVNRCQGARIAVQHTASGTYTVDVRVFDDGFGFRFVVPGADGKSRVPDAASGFRVPSGSVVWFHDFEGHYEGIHARRKIEDVRPGDWAAPPLTIQLPNGAGYASITEAALSDYAGMALQAHGERFFGERLGHAEPVSYPFALRYGNDEAARLAKPATLSGTITTPWRVVMAGADLNTLVNSDIVANLSPTPDPRLFPEGIRTAWLKPGRAVWKYLEPAGENTLETMKEFSRMAAELGFEYNLVEGFWQRWTPAQVRELVDYSRDRGVGIWLWKHSRDLTSPTARREFLKSAHEAGAVGVKVDFFDHEAKEVIDRYRAVLRDAAELQLMVDFHGANKPTGETRTWPNEMTREAVRGLEYRRGETWAGHNTTLPFTRLLAGPADYTPVVFGERRKETTAAHQIATAVVFTSPLLVYGANPKSLLSSPAVDVIKSIPSTWDQTIVLPVSEIGEIAAFARRSGDRWFLAVLNGPTARTVRIPLSFLGEGGYRAVLVRDKADDPVAVEIENRAATDTESLELPLRAAGGFVARFWRLEQGGAVSRPLDAASLPRARCALSAIAQPPPRARRSEFGSRVVIEQGGAVVAPPRPPRARRSEFGSRSACCTVCSS
ncbi:MAG TPA: glycoside hydrolase family 97 catalytic domain-containing protein [Vicinamibacteria bacterium]